MGKVAEDFAVTKDTTLKMRIDDKYIVEVEVKVGDSLKDIQAAMNKKLKGLGEKAGDPKINTGFLASYDEKNGSFFLNSTATGKEKEIELAPEIAGETDQDSIDLFKDLGLIKLDANNKVVRSKYEGKNAEYTYNGDSFF